MKRVITCLCVFLAVLGFSVCRNKTQIKHREQSAVILTTSATSLQSQGNNASDGLKTEG